MKLHGSFFTRLAVAGIWVCILVIAFQVNAIPIGGDIIQLGKTPQEKDILKARTYISKGDFDKAIESALGILKKEPQNIAALRIIIFSSIAKRDFGTAKKNLTVLQNIAPDSQELILSVANLFQAQKDYTRAILAYQQVLSREKNNTAALYALGTIYEDLNKLPLATKHYKEVLKYQPRHMGALKQLAFIYLYVKAYGLARETARRAIDFDKDNAQKSIWPYHVISESYIRQGDLKQGKAFIQKGYSTKEGKALGSSLALINILEGDYNGAEKILKGLQDKTTSLPHWGLSIIYGLSAKDYKAAYARGKTASSLTPKILHRDMITANWLVLSKEFDKALPLFQKGDFRLDLRYGKIDIKKIFQGVKPQDISEYNLCLLMLDLSWFEPAKQRLQDLSERYPESIPFKITFAKAYKSLGKWEKTKEVFTGLAKKNTDLIYTRMQLAEMAEAKKDYHESLQWREDVRRLAPDLATNYLKLGLLYEAVGNRGEAIRAYEQLNRRLPKFPVGYVQLAWLYGQDPKTMGKAFKLAEKARSLNQNDPIIADTLGWLYFKIDDYTKAREYLDFALKKRPLDPTILYHTGSVLMKLGDTKKAKEKLELALKVSEDFPEKDEVKKLLLDN